MFWNCDKDHSKLTAHHLKTHTWTDLWGIVWTMAEMGEIVSVILISPMNTSGIRKEMKIQINNKAGKRHVVISRKLDQCNKSFPVGIWKKIQNGSLLINLSLGQSAGEIKLKTNFPLISSCSKAAYWDFWSTLDLDSCLRFGTRAVC